MKTRTIGRNAILTLCFAQTACGHGPLQRYALLGDYGTPPGTSLTIALREFWVTRPARGLSGFFSGGSAISVDGGVEVGLCTKDTQSFNQIAVIHEPPERLAKQVSTPMIIAWHDTAVLITKVSGGDALVRLPPNVRTGFPPRKAGDRLVLRECKTALDSLRESRMMPDGTPINEDYLKARSGV